MGIRSPNIAYDGLVPQAINCCVETCRTKLEGGEHGKQDHHNNDHCLDVRLGAGAHAFHSGTIDLAERRKSGRADRKICAGSPTRPAKRLELAHQSRPEASTTFPVRGEQPRTVHDSPN